MMRLKSIILNNTLINSGARKCYSLDDFAAQEEIVNDYDVNQMWKIFGYTDETIRTVILPCQKKRRGTCYFNGL